MGNRPPPRKPLHLLGFRAGRPEWFASIENCVPSRALAITTARKNFGTRIVFANDQSIPFELLSPFEQQRQILELLRLLEPHKASDYRKVRLGNPAGDCGYVQLDDLKNVTRAFSFGIATDDSWDLAIAQRGVPVEQFDPAIERAPSKHSLLHFHRMAVAPNPAEGAVTLQGLVEKYSGGKRPDLLLNCDIEGGEWNVFDAAPAEALGKFTQIICEFHGMKNLSNPAFFPVAKRVFTKLHAHHAVIHVHGNNFAPIVSSHNIPLPEVIELTFANRKRYALGKSREKFPTQLDSPNNPGAPDIQLGLFQF
jgi:hypothetical protein